METSTGLEGSALQKISPFNNGDQHPQAQTTSTVIWCHLFKDKQSRPGGLVSEEEGHPPEPQGSSNLRETLGNVEFQAQSPD